MRSKAAVAAKVCRESANKDMAILVCVSTGVKWDGAKARDFRYHHCVSAPVMVRGGDQPQCCPAGAL